MMVPRGFGGVGLFVLYPGAPAGLDRGFDAHGTSSGLSEKMTRDRSRSPDSKSETASYPPGSMSGPKPALRFVWTFIRVPLNVVGWIKARACGSRVPEISAGFDIGFDGHGVASVVWFDG